MAESAFYNACQNAKLDFIKELLQEKTTTERKNLVTSATPDGKLPLLGAVESGCIETVEYLFQVCCSDSNSNIGLDVHQATPLDEKTAISVAIDKRHFSMMKYLVEHQNVDINRECDYEYCPLHIAAYNLNLEMTLYLLGRGATVDVEGPHGQSPLMCAVCAEGEDIVQALIDHGADVDHCNEYSDTPLGVAAASGNIKIAKILLSQPSINVHCDHVSLIEFGETPPIEKAFVKGHYEMIDLLLQHGANMNSMDELGRTMLYNAVRRQDGKKVKNLLSKGANVNISTTNGETPLMLATTLGNVELIQILLDHGAEVNAISKRAETAWTIALQKENHSTICNLLKPKLDLEYIDKDDDNHYHYYYHDYNHHLHRGTFLHVCARYGLAKKVRMLLEMGANSNRFDMHQCTPLQLAVAGLKPRWVTDKDHYDRIETIKLLLSYGADMNKTATYKNKIRQTPLIAASTQRRRDLVYVLLTHGAWVTITDA